MLSYIHTYNPCCLHFLLFNFKSQICLNFPTGNLYQIKCKEIDKHVLTDEMVGKRWVRKGTDRRDTCRDNGRESEVEGDIEVVFQECSVS